MTLISKLHARLHGQFPNPKDAWRSPERLAGKIQRGEQMKVHAVVIGKRDPAAAGPSAVSVRVHGKGNLGARPRGDAVAEILQSIKERACS